MPLEVSIDNLEERHLQALINREAEDMYLEFKEALPSGRPADVKEFLKDASAMANSQGGYLIFGIREGKTPEGRTLAVAVDGMAGIDPDGEILRLENLIRSSIKPRLVGYRIRAIPLSNGNVALALYIPRSWYGPHVVEHEKHWRFYYRNSAGTHPMDVTELRQAFIFSDTLGQRLAEFRAERLARIAGGEILSPPGRYNDPSGKAKVALHLQPLDSARPDVQVDVLKARKNTEGLKLISSKYATATQVTFDGLLSYMPRENFGYVQIYRSSAIESVDWHLLNKKEEEGKVLIMAPYFEERIIHAAQRYLGLIRELGNSQSIQVGLAFLGVKGYEMECIEYEAITGAGNLTTEFEHRGARPIDRDDLILPAVLIEDLSQDIARKLRLSFDAIYNAVGLDYSPYYDDEGNWTGRFRHFE